MAELTTPSRHEKSLGLLTTKFVTLLQEAKDGVLDLKVAADTLAVRQKRRIYDITNVLEGIGLIEKKSKNSIQWKGAGPGCNSQEITDKLDILKDDLHNLKEKEALLDQHKRWVQQSIKNVTDDISNHQMAYVTHEDICRCFEGDTLLAIQAPSGTQLEVPIPETTTGHRKKYQIHLKSQSGPIYVLLVNKDSDTSSPVVVEVPPPPENPASQAVTENTQNDAPNTRQSVAAKQLTQVKSSPSRSPLRAAQQMEPASRMATRSSPRKPEIKTEPVAAPTITDMDPLKDVPSDMLFGNDIKEGEFIDQLMSSEMFAPLLRLSPPPSDQDYYYNLADTEGVCDLFDVPLM